MEIHKILLKIKKKYFIKLDYKTHVYNKKLDTKENHP